MICFIGSTITEDVETLKILAKKLKKNNVAVDLVVFGDVTAEQVSKAETFVATLQNEDNSHALVVLPGQNLSDKLLGSPILRGQGVNAGGIGNLEEEDPDLAQAIRMSLADSQPVDVQPVVTVPSQPVSQPQPQVPAANSSHQPT